MANVQIRSFGGLNTDTHVQDLRNGDYPDAKNIDHISAATGESVAVTPRMGNEYAFDLGEVFAQDKSYVITFPEVESVEGYTLQVNRADQVNPLFPAFEVPLYFGDPALPPGTQAATTIQNAFESAFYPVTVVHASTVYPTLAGTNSLLITPSVNSVALRYYDYFVQSIGQNILIVDTIQESISNSRTGNLEVIGSKDLLGDLFIISSSKRDKPFEIKIINISIVVFSGISTLIVTPDITDQVILDEQEVYITGVLGIPEANGIFIIKIYPDPQTGQNLILLFNSFAVPGQTYVQGSGVIKFNSLGMGEIGVAEKDISTNTWKYTTLLRSKEFNFFTYHQCDVQGEISGDKKSIYYTDNYNPPRNFYYYIESEYVNNGALKLIDPLYGLYSYGNIANQIRHILGKNTMNIEYVTQIQNGGSLSAGNHRYFVRGVLSDGSYTDWSLPSNIIPVYDAVSTDDPYLLIGNPEGSQTGKINVIKITNIDANLYSYIEIAAIVYINITFDATIYGIFTRLKTEVGRTELEVSHRGDETSELLNQDEISVETRAYATAKNNAIIDNRYLLSNLRDGDTYNIIDFFENARYSLKYKQISALGVYPNLSFGGFLDPGNTYNYTGYMLNETYRIGARAVFKNGSISLIHKLFDVTIDTDASSTDNKRISGLSDFGLLDTATGNYKVPYIEISGLDLANSVVDGILATDIIERIEYFRAEVKTPTILGSGYAVLHCDCIPFDNTFSGMPAPTDTAIAADIRPPGQGILIGSDFSINYYSVKGDGSDFPVPPTQMPRNQFNRIIIETEFPFLSGFYFLAPGNVGGSPFYIPEYISYYDNRFTQGQSPLNGSSNGYIWNDTVASIYLIDDIINNTNTTISAGDKLINIGQPDIGPIQYDTSTLPYNYFVSLTTNDLHINKEEIDITRSKFISGDNNTAELFENNYVYKTFGYFQNVFFTSTKIKNTYRFNNSFVVKMSSSPSNLLGYYDKGVRYVQVKKNVPFQYSQTNNDDYIYVGAYQDLETGTVIDIFGGDTFTSHAYIRHMVANANNVDTAGTTITPFRGNSQGMAYLCQSRSNPNLTYKQPNVLLFPLDAANQPTDALRIQKFFADYSRDLYYYNTGYNIRLELSYRAGFSGDIKYIKYFPTRIIYSDAKPQGAISDYYRRFGQFSSTDLETTYGEINSMKNINGELYTLQVNKFQKQFFNTRGTLQVSDGSQVVLGDAGVFSRPGITITSYGCSDKWSVFLGRSAGGDDVLYWYDSINKKFMRFGADGAVPISDRANIRTLANEGFKWVINYQTPADNYGIHGIWNQRLNEAAWTCRAYRKPDVIWELGITINEGQLVIVEDTATTYGFERFPVIYKCIQTNLATIDIKPGDSFDYGLYYDTISFDDIEYYSLRTIIWSEVKNRFIISDETPHPRIYLQYRDTFLSPSPSGNSNQVFEHNEGKYLEWYIQGNLGQREDGYIDIVFNIDPNTTKHFISLICNTEIAPHKVEAFTKNHSTLINPVEFLEQLDQYVAPIPNDLLNGSTGMDNSFLYGQWIKVRFHYNSGMFQRLTNMILKFNPMARLWNS